MNPSVYSIWGFSEPFCAISHLLACAVFAVLSYFLIRRGRGHWGRVAALSVFAFSSVFLLSMSGVYHLLEPGGGPRAVMQRLDHAAIFVLIAGTFVAAHAVLFTGFWRWGMIGLIGVLAVTGITLKTIFFTTIPESLGLALYLALGWIGVISGFKVWSVHGWSLLRSLLWGGAAYSLGALFEFLRWPVLIEGVVGPHEVFHVAVIAGLAFHWRFIYQFADHSPAEDLTSVTSK